MFWATTQTLTVEAVPYLSSTQRFGRTRPIEGRACNKIWGMHIRSQNVEVFLMREVMHLFALRVGRVPKTAKVGVH